MTYQACVFDAYGTLFNLDLPTEQLKAVAGKHADDLLALWRQKQLEYTWLRGMMGRYVPFEQVTEDALHLAFETYGVENGELFDALMGIYWQPTPFPEVKDTLAKLRTQGIRTAILSNGSQRLLQAGVHHAGLRDLIDEVLSVEAVETFKPSPRVYQLAVDRLGLTREALTFQSSNGWDIGGATAFGFSTVWVNRKGAPLERLGVTPTHEVKDLTELLPVINKQRST